MATKTYAPRPRDIERRWYVVDAEGAVLGRLASEVAKILRGKHKPMFAPHMDTGDHVIVVNARAVRLTGGKDESKIWYRHSGFPGGIREMNYARLLAERPATVVEKAVRGMLPKNRLGRAMIKKLSVYEGAEHPHQAQKPKTLGLGEIPKWEGLPTPPPPAVRAPREATRPRKGPPPDKDAREKAPRAPVARRARSKTAAVEEAKTSGRRRGGAAAERSADPAPQAPPPTRRRARSASKENEGETAPKRPARTSRASRKSKES